MPGTATIWTTSRRELSSSFFFPLQGKAPKEIHAILTETLACFLLGLRTCQHQCRHIYSFFNLCTRWSGWLLSRFDRFTSGKEIRYALYRRLRGPQDQSERMRKIPLPPGFDFWKYVCDWRVSVCLSVCLFMHHNGMSRLQTNCMWQYRYTATSTFVTSY